LEWKPHLLGAGVDESDGFVVTSEAVRYSCERHAQRASRATSTRRHTNEAHAIADHFPMEVLKEEENFVD